MSYPSLRLLFSPLDPSLTASNVCTALEALRDLDKVCDVLRIPLHWQNRIRIEYCTYSEKRQKQAMVEWWLQYSPHASWNWLAGQLYFHEEWTALKAVLQLQHNWNTAGTNV